MRHIDLVPAGAGVHAAIAKPDRGAVGNAAVVDLGTETLVVGDEEGAALLEEYAAELPGVTHRLPDATLDEERDYGGAQAVTLGGGHTESDAFLLVPEARVLVAGDLVVVGMQPWAGHGDPAEWASILERMLELEWETCVPGHGPVSGREVVEPLRDYLFALDEAVRGEVDQPELPERFRDWGQPQMWERNVSALRSTRRGPEQSSEKTQ